jgi:hypothetical protein
MPKETDYSRSKVQRTGQSISQAFDVDVDKSVLSDRIDVYNLLIAAEQAGTGFLDVSLRLAGTDDYVQMLSTTDGSPVAFDLSAPDILVIEGFDIGSVRLTPRSISGVTSVRYSLHGVPYV